MPGRLPDTFHPEQEFLSNEKQWRADSMPLFAMQSAICHTAIKAWEHVEETEPGEDGRSHHFSQEEKINYVKALQEEIEQLTRTQRAACEEVILPCRPAPVGWEGFHENSLLAVPHHLHDTEPSKNRTVMNQNQKTFTAF